jgi:hypothetical protein
MMERNQEYYILLVTETLIDTPLGNRIGQDEIEVIATLLTNAYRVGVIDGSNRRENEQD